MRVFAVVLALAGVPACACAQVGIAGRVESGLPLSVGMPLLLSRGRVLIEPTLSLDRYTSTTREDSASGTSTTRSEATNTHLHVGVGAYLRSAGPVGVYGGPRLGYVVNVRAFEASGSGSFGTFAQRQRGTQHGWAYGALLGAEATVTTGVTVGLELQWLSETISGEIEQTIATIGGTTTDRFELENGLSETGAAMVFRWYPGRRAKPPEPAPPATQP